MRSARMPGTGRTAAIAAATTAAYLLPFAVASSSLLPWRADGRCGDAVVAPDGSRPARCNPWHPEGHTCCSAGGWCGRSKDQCLCATCVNYQVREPWRSDGRCGEDVEGKDGTKPAQCNPLDALNRTCCSDVGWCGGSKEHCDCLDCLQFFGTCSCSPAAPCKDPYSGLCYPRTETVDEWAEDNSALNESALEDFRVSGLDTHDSLGRLLDPRNLAINMDRRPEYDPQGGSMKNQMLLEKHDPKFVAMVRKLGDSKVHIRGRGLHHVTQQPTVLGMRCAAPLVDCVGDAAASHPPPSSPGVAASAGGRAAASPTSPQSPLSPRLVAPGGGRAGLESEPAGSEPAATVLKPKKNKQQEKLNMLPVRLSNGDTPKEGRVEVLFQGQWGSVCDADWDWADARVVCKQLGFKGVDGTTYQASFGEGSGPIWLSNVECTGRETSLLDCSFYGLNRSMLTTACSHHRSDAGVVCSSEVTPTSFWAEEGKRAGEVREKARERVQRAVIDATGHVGEIVDITDLRSALSNLERVILLMEVERPIIDNRDLSRLARLRIRLNRLAGRKEPPLETVDCPDCSCDCTPKVNETELPTNESGTPESIYTQRAEAQRRQQQKEQDKRDAELGISEKMKRQIGPELLASLRAMPSRNVKSLEESRKEFEEKPYDPFENDPVAKFFRSRPEPSYVPPGMEPRPLRPRPPDEPLLKPPITKTAISRELQKKWMREETERAVKEGTVGPEMLRTVGPGPWDDDEAFWSSPYDSGAHDAPSPNGRLHQRTTLSDVRVWLARQTRRLSGSWRTTSPSSPGSEALLEEELRERQSH